MANKGTIWSVAGVGAALASIVAVHQSIDYITDHIVYPYVEPKIDSTIANYLEKHPQGSTLQILGLVDDITEMFTIEKEAFLSVIHTSNLMNWHHMEDTVIHGYNLKFQDGVLFTMFKGIIFEANYKRSARKFYFTDGYGVEKEADIIPIIH